MFENMNISFSCIMPKFKKQIAYTFLKSLGFLSIKSCWYYLVFHRYQRSYFELCVCVWRGRGGVCEWFVFGVEVGLGFFIILDNAMFKRLFTNANNKEMSVYTSKILPVFHRDNGCLHCWRKQQNYPKLK